VLGNLSGLFIRGEYSNGGVGTEFGGLDNVRLRTVPEPSSFMLAATALVILGVARHRGRPRGGEARHANSSAVPPT
jgi:hypothetical protein